MGLPSARRVPHGIGYKIGVHIFFHPRPNEGRRRSTGPAGIGLAKPTLK